MAEDQYIVRKVISLGDPDYFCNRSFTLSFNMNTKSWISFHSYIPNWYIAENNFFYSGLNNCCDDFEFIAGETPFILEGCRIEGQAVTELCFIQGTAYYTGQTITTTSTTTISSNSN